MPTTPINGVQLYWKVTGASGDPLVLAHGSWQDHHSWDAVVPRLSQRFRVLTYDRRGHSASESIPGTVHDDVADLGALVEQLDIAPAHIAGSSSGASIVLRLAGARPDLFRTLIAHEPPLLDLIDDDPGVQHALAAVRARLDEVQGFLEADRFRAAAQCFVERVALGPGAWAQLPEAVRQRFIINAPTFRDEMRDPDMGRLDLSALQRFASPFVLTKGEASPPFFALIIEHIRQALPHADVRVFRGAGHVPHATAPGRYAQLVMDVAGATR
jgi:pimeloyl-ACP methyl ester carboxylesterase